MADYDQKAAGSGDYRLSFHLGGSPLVIPEGDEGGPLQIGKRNQGTTATGDRDCWTIQANAAEPLRFVAIRADNSNFKAHISIWGPAGELITSYFGISNTASATLNWTPPASGLYTVSIIDGNQAAGETCSYYLQCARALPEGEVVIEGGDEGGVLTPGDHDGSIPVGDQDPWVFDAVAGDQVTLALAKRGDMSLHCNLQVYGPDGSLFLSAISDSNTTLPVNLTGRYTAWVSDLQYGGGDYRFSYARTPGSSAIPAGTSRGSLNSGGNYSGSLAAGGVDLWTFTAEAGERVILRGTNTGIIATPRLRVTGPDGIRVAEVSRTDSAMTEFTCTSAGTFTVAVDDRDGVVSSYLLCMAKTAGSFEIPSGDQGGVIGSGEEVSALLTRGDMDFWSFTASAGVRVRVHLTEMVPSGTTATLTPDLRIYRPDGSLMAAVSKSDFADPDSTAAVEFICDAAGSYLIRAAKTDARAGTCTVRMVKSTGAYAFAPQDRGGLIFSGSEEIAPLAPGDVDLWHFQAVAGQRFSFHMNSMGGLMNPNVRVFAPDGRMIAERWNSTNAIVDFGCDVAGTYLVEVRDHAERYSGSYRLCLYELTGTFSTPAGDQGGEITNSSPGQGSVHAGDVDLWSFEASEGEPVRVHISDPVDIRVFSPSGKLVGQRENQTSKSIGFRAVESGTYTVVLYTYSSYANPSNYVCKLAKGFGDADAPAGDEGGLIASGVEVSGSVSEPDVDLWFINAEAGDHLDVRLVSPSGTFYPQIYRPDGSLMYGSVTIESNVALYLSCDMAGRYAIEVRPGYYGGGSYSLNASNTRGSYAPPLASDQGGTLPSDNLMVGSLSPQDVDLWSFTSKGGEGATFTPAGTGSSPTFDIDVYRPDGSRIASSRYFNSVPFSFETDVPGTYRFSIRSHWGNTPSDSYSITVGFKAGGLFPVPGGAGGTLASGVLQAASLANGTSTFWAFHANAGDALSFLLSVSGGDDEFVPKLRIYSPQGILIGIGSALNLTALAAGSYYVEVVDTHSGGGSGQYEILATGTVGPVLGITLISPEPGMLILSWPSSFPGALQQSDTLEAGSWQIVPAAPHDDGYSKHIEIDTGDAPRRYYRLAEP